MWLIDQRAEQRISEDQAQGACDDLPRTGPVCEETDAATTATGLLKKPGERLHGVATERTYRRLGRPLIPRCSLL